MRRDPVEDAALDRKRFEEVVHDLEQFNKEIEHYHRNIERESIDLMADFMRLVVTTSDVRKKAERLDEELSKL